MQTSKLGRFFGIGIGPGDPELLTLKAARLLQECQVIFTVISAHVQESVSESLVRAHVTKGEIIQLSFSMSRDSVERTRVVAENAERILSALRQGKDCAYTTIGDPLTYSTFGYMLALIKAAEPSLHIEIVPGITSYSMLAAKTEQVLAENTEQIRVIPSFKASMAQALVFEQGVTTVLLKSYKSRTALLKRLSEEKNLQIVYGENLGMPNEFVTDRLGEIEQRPDCYLSLFIVKKL